ncbi:MAG TPA: TetR/AcrR family transcriptional regulator C-terminal domain-containing protein [Acidimicrobiales bacterium]|nr:TetR/AcrR family transcriptional regulator C-terminal domain-containing protein [Acidimicrobiales bacterium]
MATGKRQGSAGSLSGDQVIGAALAIVRSEGADRLTIRGLAAKLGVAVTAVYWHVGDKQALLDGVVDRVIEDIGEVAAGGRGPEARLVSVGRSLRRSLLEHADLVALVQRQGRTAALFQPARRVLVRELTAAGLEGEEAAMALQAILNLVVGSVLIDRQVARQPVQREAPEELWTAADVPEAPELLPHLAHHQDEERLFDYTLRALVGAVVGGRGRGRGGGGGPATAPDHPGPVDQTGPR